MRVLSIRRKWLSYMRILYMRVYFNDQQNVYLTFLHHSESLLLLLHSSVLFQFYFPSFVDTKQRLNIFQFGELSFRTTVEKNFNRFILQKRTNHFYPTNILEDFNLLRRSVCVIYFLSSQEMLRVQHLRLFIRVRKSPTD